MRAVDPATHRLRISLRDPTKDPSRIAALYHACLRTEVTTGNPYLGTEEQMQLRGHYPALMAPRRYPPELLSELYAHRRALPLQVVLEEESSSVFDAGCGYGTDSFLFAATGARVMAVDLSAQQVEIALKRKRYYEELFDRPLKVSFQTADLDQYVPEKDGFSLTWVSSVLAALRDQDAFLDRVCKATRPGGKVMVVDFNLLNPVFLWSEWRRRRRSLAKSPEFARHADFWAMIRRMGRRGAHFFPQEEGAFFDDVQFFTPGILQGLLERTGFTPLSPAFSGFAHPVLFGSKSALVEKAVSRTPVLKWFGRAYLVAAVKEKRS